MPRRSNLAAPLSVDALNRRVAAAHYRLLEPSDYFTYDQLNGLTSACDGASNTTTSGTYDGVIPGRVSNTGVLAELVIGRLGWSISAYALCANRLDGLAAVMSAPISRAYEERSQPRFAVDSKLRHSRLRRSRARDDRQLCDWLAVLELVQHLPLFDATQQGGFFDEADLALALALHGQGGRAFTNRLRPDAARRLGARLADRRNAEDLGTAFGLSADAVAPTVDQWYQDLRNNMQREMTFDVLPERLTQGT
jgi:hypothetical protein